MSQVEYGGCWNVGWTRILPASKTVLAKYTKNHNYFILSKTFETYDVPHYKLNRINFRQIVAVYALENSTKIIIYRLDLA